jgi:phenylacetate-coenzyme A ligase PaaK-like adenylate-forming protein
VSLPTRLYFGLPVWAQNALLSTYGVALGRRRYGGIHRTVVSELRRSQWFSARDLEAMQLARANEVIAQAAETVPWYRGLRASGDALSNLEELAGLPTLTKDDVRVHLRELVSTAPRNGHLEEVHTGGTTGTPLTIYCDRATLQRNYAFFARLREWAGVPEGARVATFAGRTIVPPEQSRPPFWRHNAASNTVLYSSYHLGPATIPDYVAHLKAWKPALIDSYPSSLEPIARYVLANGINSIRPAAVITSSETLSPEVRRSFVEAFGAPVFDHYGGGEMAAFISQCERGSYHVNPEFGVVELLNDGVPARAGEVGEITATGFVNPIMPLIRYRTGDLAAFTDRPCSCGRNFPVIEQLLGRSDDVVVTPDGRRVGRLDPIFKAVSSFYESRIVQDAEDHVCVEYVAESEVSPAERETLTRELQSRLGPSMRIDVVRVAAIPRTRRGKLRMVVNQVRQ